MNPYGLWQVLLAACGYLPGWLYLFFLYGVFEEFCFLFGVFRSCPVAHVRVAGTRKLVTPAVFSPFSARDTRRGLEVNNHNHPEGEHPCICAYHYGGIEDIHEEMINCIITTE